MVYGDRVGLTYRVRGPCRVNISCTRTV